MREMRPVFVTRQPLRVGAVSQLLAGAGISSEPQLIHPDEFEHADTGAEECLVIVDGQSLSAEQSVGQLRRHSPRSRMIVWTDRLSPDLLLDTMECGLDGLLSSRLPLDEAVCALERICRGERILRFDSDASPGRPRPSAAALAASASFDAQWMLDGAESTGREK